MQTHTRTETNKYIILILEGLVILGVVLLHIPTKLHIIIKSYNYKLIDSVVGLEFVFIYLFISFFVFFFCFYFFLLSVVLYALEFISITIIIAL